MIKTLPLPLSLAARCTPMFNSFKLAASSRWLFSRISCSRIKSPLMFFNCISLFRMSSIFSRILASSKRITILFRRVAPPAASAWSRASTSFKPEEYFNVRTFLSSNSYSKDSHSSQREGLVVSGNHLVFYPLRFYLWRALTHLTSFSLPRGTWLLNAVLWRLNT